MAQLPDFEGLAMFAKVAEHGSFAAAARATGVSVATVSRGVARLEERLGARLFNRTSRQLSLTEFGRTISEKAGEIYRQAEEAESSAREMSVQPRGLVRLAVPMSYGLRWVAPLLPGFFALIQRCRSTCICRMRRSIWSPMGSTPRCVSPRFRIHPWSRGGCAQ